MSTSPSSAEDRNRRMLRARDAMDRAFATPLDLATVARIAHVSENHFGRQFKATFGETPHQYLRRRRIERAMFMLRQSDTPITEICLDVGFVSLGSFSTAFRQVVGESPSGYRERIRAAAAPVGRVPVCWAMTWMRPGPETEPGS